MTQAAQRLAARQPGGHIPGQRVEVEARAHSGLLAASPLGLSWFIDILDGVFVTHMSRHQ
jgi:hypothetical protein